MAFDLELTVIQSFVVRASREEVWAVIADVPLSASHFPDVDRLVPLGDGVYRWELKSVGLGGMRLQTVYATRYVADAAAGTVTWTAVEGIGNTRVSGQWRMAPQGTGTRLDLRNVSSFHLPLPGPLRRVISPAAEAVHRAAVGTYVDNLARRFGGRIG